MAKFQVKLQVNASEVRRVSSLLQKVGLIAAAGVGDMMPTLGRLIVKQTQNRITSEKTSPDGGAWPANIRGTPVLDMTGALAKGINHKSGRFHTVITHGGQVYANIHQLGGTIRPVNKRRLAFNVNGTMVYASQSNIPARPYLGISAANWAEIEVTVDAFVRRAFGWLF